MAYSHPFVLALANLGWPEILIILFVILILFGAKRLPELARGFGKSIREFKKATSEVEDDIRSALEDEPVQRPTAEQKKIPATPAPPPAPAPTAATTEQESSRSDA